MEQKNKRSDRGNRADEKAIRTYGNEYRGRAVIISIGAMLGSRKFPGEEELLGKGVSYCSTFNAPFYKGKTVALAGVGSEINYYFQWSFPEKLSGNLIRLYMTISC